MGKGSGRHRVLVMDDDLEIRRLLRLWLENEGFEVAEAKGGEEGLRLHKASPFDLVVADLYMPEGDGLAFLTAVQPRKSGLPVIAISGGLANVKSEGLDLARYLGATRTLAKPFNPGDLAAAAHELLAATPPKRGLKPPDEGPPDRG